MRSTARPTSGEDSAAPLAAGMGARLRHRLGRLRAPWQALRPPWVGEVLLKEEVITPAQLDKALARQREVSQPIGLTIVEMGLAGEDEVLAAINKHFRIAATALTENIAALIRSRANSRRSLSRLRHLLRVRLSLVVVAAIWLTTLAVGAVLLTWHQSQLRAELRHLGATSVRFLAEGARASLLNDDLTQLGRVVQAAAQTDGVRYAIVTDRDGAILAAAPARAAAGTPAAARPAADPAARGERLAGDVRVTEETDAQGRRLLRLSKPIVAPSGMLGWAQLGLSLAGVEREVWRGGLLLGLLSLIVGGLGVALAIQQGGRLLQPVSALLDSSPVGRSAEEFRVRVRRRHEFEDLVASFDHISSELTQKLMVERSFGRYVSPAVLEMIRANPEQSWFKGRRDEASILFTDVRGFTAVAETREPEAIVDALNEYFVIATTVIVEQGGYVDKYIGDAVLGVFGVPEPLHDHALHAVKAAVTMQNRLRRRARTSRNPFLDKIGIGINSGLVLSGNVGSNEKLEYTVIGDCVNLASRLNALAEAGEIVISDSVANRIPSHLITLRTLEAQHVKGKREPVVAHKVLRTDY